MPDQQDPMRLVVSVGAIVVLLATVALSLLSLRDHSATSPLSLIGAHQGSAEGRELERCRTITPEELASDQACRRAWAELRQRFLGLDHEAGKASTTKVPPPPSQPSETPPENTNRANARRPTIPAPQED
jgi:conjugative transfer region protein TrbK